MRVAEYIFIREGLCSRTKGEEKMFKRAILPKAEDIMPRSFPHSQTSRLVPLLLVLMICCFSCKKEYTCSCGTLNSGSNPQTFEANKQTYVVKEKNESEAVFSCTKEYQEVGGASGIIQCKIQ